jgi:hypothetical protein
MAAMGDRARARFEAEFTPQKNYQQLMDIYRIAQQDSTQSGQS